jgi:hypothetical protein
MARFQSDPHNKPGPLTSSTDASEPEQDADEVRLIAMQPQSSAPSQWVVAGDWIEYVIQITGVERSQLLSKARSRYLTLPRALATHHGRELGFTLAELAHHLERHPSSLLEAVERSLSSHPQLFTPAVTRLFTEQQDAKLRRLLARHTLRRPPSH